MIDPSESAETLAFCVEDAGLHQPVHWVGECGSSNAHARALADEGAAHGTAVFAHHQTAGRGRLGRLWQAPAGQNLTLSIVLRPDLSPQVLPMVVLAAGVATAQACGHGTRLKWPNDLLSADGLKVSGLLAEAEFKRNAVQYVIVGVGVNVGWAPPDLPATCLQALGARVTPEQLAVTWVQRMLEWVRVLGEPTQVLAAWRALDATAGRRINIGGIAGIARGIADNGELLVESDDGVMHAIRAGDVQMVG
ncbi:MAG: biotin--[acetyl-CoA-carboxylase] ligase [Myxococcota bacterium]